MIVTNHARRRMHERCIPPIIVDWLLGYGSTNRAPGGALVYHFDREAKRRLIQDLGRPLMRRIEDLLDNTYAVVADDEILVTTGKRYRPIQKR